MYFHYKYTWKYKLFMSKIYFHTWSYQPNDFITSLWLLIKEILKFNVVHTWFSIVDLSHVLSDVLEPQLLGQTLSKTPLQTWWDLKDIAQQDREKSSFSIILNCYTSVILISPKKIFHEQDWLQFFCNVNFLKEIHLPIG